jgi:hypothetical protein
VRRSSVRDVSLDPPGDADALLSAFARWSAHTRVRDEVAGRARQRWLEQQAAEAATLTGTLLDLAEGEAPVTVLSTQRRFSGRLVGVGSDLCVLEAPARVTVIALRQVIAVRPHPSPATPRPPTASGDRAAHLTMTFRSALAAMAMDLSPVRLALIGTETLTGELTGAGDDVITLRLPGIPPRPAYLPIAAVEAFSPQ